MPLQNRLTVPTGMQDTLPGECARKRELERDLRALFGGVAQKKTPFGVFLLFSGDFGDPRQ